jgi:hypothetical protein
MVPSNIAMKICAILICAVILAGCTRDDICADGTPTTPQLIILFRDIANPTQAKSVPSLTVSVSDFTNRVVLSETTSDSIAIPLNPGTNGVTYQFIRAAGTNNPNIDYLEFSYTTEDEYVNRACGYKTIYSELRANLQNEGTANWIIRTDTLKTNITDALEAHFVIFH